MVLPLSNELLEQHNEEILRAASCTLYHISDVNFWQSDPQNPQNPQNLDFTGKDIPNLPIFEYLKRLQKYFRCSPMICLSSLCYVDRFLDNSGLKINNLTIHRLLIVAFVISVKFWEDVHYSNEYYSQVGGIDLSELNKLESYMLNKLNFDLHIPTAHFQQYFHEMNMHPQLCPICKQNSPKNFPKNFPNSVFNFKTNQGNFDFKPKTSESESVFEKRKVSSQSRESCE